MSDCSTAAMLPKEQPKTCGTCGRWIEVPLTGDDVEDDERIGVCECCWIASIIPDESVAFEGLEPADSKCDGEYWIPRTSKDGEK